MKLSFSTLGCPDFSWTDIYSMAKDLNFDGIEIRGLGDDIFAVTARPFTEGQLPKTKQTLKEIGIEIPCLSSGCCLKFKNEYENVVFEITQYAVLAQKLGTPYIRVLADLDPQPNGEVDDEYVSNLLKELAVIAKNHDVTLIVETNGVYSDTKRLKTLLDKVGSNHVAALWDMHHPYRYANESPEQTVENLGEYIKYVHVKDSVIVDGKADYRLMGGGDLPIKDMLANLQKNNYDGYVSLEWVKRWANHLSDAGVVFPHFANYMSVYKSDNCVDVSAKSSLQDNKTKTGKYIWKKEMLIDCTFPEVLNRVCKEFPDQYAFKYTELDYTRTYKEFSKDVDDFARSLVAMGVKKGDHVAIWATNVQIGRAHV